MFSAGVAPIADALSVPFYRFRREIEGLERPGSALYDLRIISGR